MGAFRELYQPADSWIGAGAIERIPDYIRRLGCRRALVVSDEGLVRIGTVGRVLNILDAAKLPYTLFTGVQANPTIEMVERAREHAQREECDYIIGIGGGSPLDVSKAVAILSVNGGSVRDYEGINRSEKPGLPLIAVNTTAGTGSEVTRDYVITDTERKVKMLMVDSHCIARLAVNDPWLMMGMPPGLTAATGLDALTHAIEAYVSKGHFPYTDALALEAVRRIVRALPRAFDDGNDLEARTEMCWAEYMAGLAFSNAGLGMVHAMAHQLGGFYNIPHGVANAILLPYVMDFNRTICRDRYADVASAMGIQTAGMTKDQASAAAVMYVRVLTEKLKIPSLESQGFHPENVMRLSANAMNDTCMRDNPRESGLTDVRDVFLRAYRAT